MLAAALGSGLKSFFSVNVTVGGAAPPAPPIPVGTCTADYSSTSEACMFLSYILTVTDNPAICDLMFET